MVLSKSGKNRPPKGKHFFHSSAKLLDCMIHSALWTPVILLPIFIITTIFMLVGDYRNKPDDALFTLIMILIVFSAISIMSGPLGGLRIYFDFRKRYKVTVRNGKITTQYGFITEIEHENILDYKIEEVPMGKRFGPLAKGTGLPAANKLVKLKLAKPVRISLFFNNYRQKDGWLSLDIDNPKRFVKYITPLDSGKTIGPLYPVTGSGKPIIGGNVFESSQSLKGALKRVSVIMLPVFVVIFPICAVMFGAMLYLGLQTGSVLFIGMSFLPGIFLLIPVIVLILIFLQSKGIIPKPEHIVVIDKKYIRATSGGNFSPKFKIYNIKKVDNGPGIVKRSLGEFSGNRPWHVGLGGCEKCVLIEFKKPVTLFNRKYSRITLDVDDPERFIYYLQESMKK